MCGRRAHGECRRRHARTDELSPATLDDALEADALASPSMRRRSARRRSNTDAYAVAARDDAPSGGDADDARRFRGRSAGDGGDVERAPPCRRATRRNRQRCLRHAIAAPMTNPRNRPRAARSLLPSRRRIGAARRGVHPRHSAGARSRQRPPTRRADARRPSSRRSPPVLVPGSRDWDALAEEIRMQVLQRLDLFTDTGMRDQLGARLQPIVDRASAELVETINQRARRARARLCCGSDRARDRKLAQAQRICDADRRTRRIAPVAVRTVQPC